MDRGAWRAAVPGLQSQTGREDACITLCASQENFINRSSSQPMGVLGPQALVNSLFVCVCVCVCVCLSVSLFLLMCVCLSGSLSISLSCPLPSSPSYHRVVYCVLPLEVKLSTTLLFTQSRVLLWAVLVLPRGLLAHTSSPALPRDAGHTLHSGRP